MERGKKSPHLFQIIKKGLEMGTFHLSYNKYSNFKAKTNITILENNRSPHKNYFTIQMTNCYVMFLTL